VAQGAFYVDGDGGQINFSVTLKDGEIPENQGELVRLVGEMEMTLKVLFPKQDDLYSKYFNRLLGAAQAGLVGDNPPTDLCIKSVTQLKTELALREGRRIKTQYLVELGYIAGLCGGIAVLLAAFGPAVLDKLKPFLIVWAGSMAGLWVSYAVRRTNTTYEELVSMDRRTTEAVIRVVYVGLVATIFALFLDTNVMAVTLGGFNLAAFPTSVTISALLGVVTGFSEQTLPTKLLDTGRKAME
jgi:hypothetical protein